MTNKQKTYRAPKAIYVQVDNNMPILSGSRNEMGSGSTTDFNDKGDISDAFDEV